MTKRQRELLEDLVGMGGSFAAIAGREITLARKLVAAGLAEWRDGKFCRALHITEAGRAALAKEGK